MNEIKIFENPAFGRVRTLVISGEPWFVGKDVAEVLGYKNPQEAIRAHVDDEDKGVSEILTPGGKQNTPIINESGLYSLILSSKLPTAKEFKRWVTSDVLPSIRRSGGYIAGQEDMTDEELMAKALLVAHRQIQQRDERIKSLEGENSALLVETAIMRPKADYFDDLVDRNLLTNFRETAKEIGVKQKALVAFLVGHKYLYRDKRGKLMPYAKHVDSGLFEVKECFNEKTQWGGTQTMVTPKGRETFRLLCTGI